MNEWIINENYLFIYKINKQLNNDKIFIFDLDKTLIQPKSGNVFPINEFDWKFNSNNVQTKINELSINFNIGIITNQMGLKNQNLINKWIIKMNNIMKQININFVFVSLKNDKYRKPMIGSLEILNTYGFDLQKFKLKYYIGDACGRINDHTDTDLKFALNSSILKFKTPEKFFENKKNLEMTITYPKLNYYTINNYNNIINDIIKIINNNPKIIIMMIGFPACGKSFLRNLILNKLDNVYYYNNDDIKDNINNKKLCKLINCVNKDKIINDNTNMSLDNRNSFLEKFTNYYKIGIYFNYDIDIALHLNYYRMYYYNKPLINKIIYNKLNKNFVLPNKKEFDKLIIIDDIFPNFKSDIKYFF